MIKIRERPVSRATPLTPRSDRPFAALDAALLLMIQHHEGKPCPTRKEIREWTGMPRRRVWVYLEGMRERRLIDLEVCQSKEVGKEPRRRRMRKAGGAWTEWTARPGAGRKLSAETIAALRSSSMKHTEAAHLYGVHPDTIAKARK